MHLILAQLMSLKFRFYHRKASKNLLSKVWPPFALVISAILDDNGLLISRVTTMALLIQFLEFEPSSMEVRLSSKKLKIAYYGVLGWLEYALLCANCIR